MQIIRYINNLQLIGCVATIGNFDGMHLGHQSILNSIRNHSLKLRLPCCVIIFEPHPNEYFLPHLAPVRLTRLHEKLELFRKQSIDIVLCIKFNKRFSELSAHEFIYILVNGLSVKHLEVGDDFHFGFNRSGNLNVLIEASKIYGFTVKATQTITLDGIRISSSRIRQLLYKNDFYLVERLLGRKFSLSGKVLHGKKLASKIFFPTANIQLKRHKVPLHGVYLVNIFVNNKSYPGIANIGTRPTIHINGESNLEVHLLDFSGNLYGLYLKVEFLKKIRDEICFPTIKALKIAISNDIYLARNYWALKNNKD